MRASLFPTSILATVLLLLSATGVNAQDVIVTGPSLYDATTIPGEVPAQLKGRLRVSWPDELTKSDQPSYVIATLYVDEKGKHGESRYFASNNYFSTAVSEAVTKAKFDPAMSEGKPVGSVVWLATIFNPRTSKEAARDASPRLLARQFPKSCAMTFLRNQRACTSPSIPTRSCRTR